MFSKPKAQKDRITLKDLEKSVENSHITAEQAPQDADTNPQDREDNIPNQPDKGACMGKSKRSMDFCELKRFLILQRAGCLTWMADHAYQNFGWVALKPLHQAQGARIKWDALTEDQDSYTLEGVEEVEWLQKYPYRVYYFFGDICKERQTAQREIIFKDSAEVLDFLLNLYKPYAHFDPKFSKHQTMVNLDLEVEKEKNRAQYLYDQALQSWSHSFENTLKKIGLETPSGLKIPLSSLPFFPKALSPLLEKYRHDDAYVFQTTYSSPANLPKFDPEILRANLSESLRLWQEHLEECMDNLVPPQRKPKFKRKVRKQLAKLCFKQHCGLITPDYIEHFKLHDPEDPAAIKAVANEYIAKNFPSSKDRITIPEESTYFALRRFFVDGQKHYYMEQALWVWAWQRLLEIFNGSLETREVRDQLLARLSPEQAQEFEQAFYENIEDKQNPLVWSLIHHLAFPLAVFQYENELIIAKNLNFKPAVFLNDGAHDNNILRILFFFGRVKDEENVQEILQTYRDYIPTYTPPTPPPQDLTPPKLPLLPPTLAEDFAKWWAEIVDVHTESLFFDDKEAFAKKILELQRQFLNESPTLAEDFAKWWAELVDTHTEALFVEDRQAFMKKILETLNGFFKEKTALEGGFVKWWAELVDTEMEGLFFDDKEAFMREFLKAQHQFLKENAIWEENFAQYSDCLGENIRAIFCEDIKVFVKKVLKAQNQFLKKSRMEKKFASWCADSIDVDTEGLFFDDKQAFMKKIFKMQNQFLKGNAIWEEAFSTWYIDHWDESEDKKTFLRKILEAHGQFFKEKGMLENEFANWCADQLRDAELEELFFDDKEAFIRKMLAMQERFFKSDPSIDKPYPMPTISQTAPNPNPKQPPTQDKYSPKAIKAYLDQFVIGQEDAKKGMSLVFSDHYKRINGQSGLEKANAICIGPSGSGKTFLIEMATKYLDIPYCIANAASFTPTGYLGNETNQMFATLYNNADKDIEKAQKGVLVLDEIDKLGQGSWHDKEWRQGVQNELLKVIEKGIVSFEYGGRANGETITLQTDHMLFIVLGHFEKLWKNNQLKTPHQKLPKFSNEDLIECGMKREFLRRFCVRVVFEPVDLDMLTQLLDRRLKPFQEEFAKEGSALEFTQEAKRILVEEALHEGVGMSALDQKLHEILMPLRFDIETYRGFKCLIGHNLLKSGCVRMIELLDNTKPPS
ncbi:AAA family ATPase [Helicobacter vulpis]|uniref:AAA family ATPase n=1 Tax=Helicobacter vulpis TaxID=2316076 RepID=UPI001F1A7B31|nr:AAA family ATPase [Helicobacter vulpis]